MNGSPAISEQNAYEAQVLDAWMLRSVRAVNGHYESAREFEWQARWLSVAALLATLAAAVLTASILAASDVIALRISAAVVARSPRPSGCSRRSLICEVEQRNIGWQARDTAGCAGS